MALNAFPLLCNHHHHHLQNGFTSPPAETPLNNSHSPSPNMSIPLCLCEFDYSGHLLWVGSYKMYPFVPGLFYSVMFSKLLCVVACASSPFLFYGWVIFHCSYRPHVVYQLGCFHLVALVNNTVMILEVQFKAFWHMGFIDNGNCFSSCSFEILAYHQSLGTRRHISQVRGKPEFAWMFSPHSLFPSPRMKSPAIFMPVQFSRYQHWVRIQRCPTCSPGRLWMQPQNKIANSFKTLWDYFVCVITCHSGLSVWPKTTLLLPVWPRDTKRLDTPVRLCQVWAAW